jgi:F0F1-type ATP synthase membrane subunit b/b'
MSKAPHPPVSPSPGSKEWLDLQQRVETLVTTSAVIQSAHDEAKRSEQDARQELKKVRDELEALRMEGTPAFLSQFKEQLKEARAREAHWCRAAANAEGEHCADRVLTQIGCEVESGTPVWHSRI